jgi:hypothetical protein
VWDAACPLSTRGGTRLVWLVRGRWGPSEAPHLPLRPAAAAAARAARIEEVEEPASERREDLPALRRRARQPRPAAARRGAARRACAHLAEVDPRDSVVVGRAVARTLGRVQLVRGE